MNTFGISLVWLVGQVTLLCVVTAVIYLFARRRHPAAGATAVLSGLLLTVVLSLGMFSSWPRWSFESRDAVSVVEADSDSVVVDEKRPLTPDGPATRDDADATSHTGGVAGAQPALESKATVAWRTFWSSLGDELVTPSSQAVDTRMRWTGWLAIGLLLTFVIGAVRLISGWVTVRGYLRRSELISDRSLCEAVDVLRAELACTRDVELRESKDVTSPATVGWRRPVILLPMDWRDWSQSERRAVLAHELAHVTSGDAATWLAAQLRLILHFYHPLMHWLAQRLRLEQELAADALAAHCLGDSQTYLTTLAELAVRQPDRPLAWPARAFLPTRGTLLRRIEMLRDTKAPPLRSSLLRRGTVIALTVIVGLFVAGLRPPESSQAVAQERSTTDTAREGRGVDIKKEREGFDLENVPASTVLLVGLRPAQIADRPELMQVVSMVEESLEPEKSGLRVEDIDQYLMFASGPLDPGFAPVTEIRTKEATDFSAFLKEQIGNVEPQAVGDESIWVLADTIRPERSPSAYQPNDRTLLFGMRKIIEQLASQKNRQSDEPAWSQRRQPLSDGEACLVVDVAQVRPLIQQEFQRKPNPMMGMFVPLWTNTDLVVGGMQFDKQVTTTLQAWCGDAESAGAVKQTLDALVPFARGMLESAKVRLQDAPQEMRQSVQSGVAFAEAFLDNAKIRQQDDQVVVSFAGDASTLAAVAAVTLPALQQAREAARRTQTRNNLKVIGLGFHNFHDVYGHFPPPVVYGKYGDGKSEHPHSWRVAILPFVNANDLYLQYHFDEPWDSEHNKTILNRMPAVFRSPNDETGSTNAAYFALVGEQTAVGEKSEQTGQPTEGIKIRDITDGTSNTLVVVEAKRDIPWTKPEDILYAGDKDMPEFGGWHDGGFHSLMSDGSVRFINQLIDEQLLRALITLDGGETLPNF